MFDLIIIGGGPGGCSAAVYAARKQLKALIVTPEFGGQSIVSETIYNWIGTPEISGIDLAKSLEAHVRFYEGDYLTVKTGAHVESVTKSSAGFSVTTDTNETFEARSVLVTTGSSRRKLAVPGAAEFDNKGVVYCASCDGPLFAGQDVAVIGGGNAGFETAAQLLAYVKSVTLLQRDPRYKADEITVQKVLAHPNMTGILNVETTKVLGEKFVTGLVYKDRATGEEHEIPVTGIFVEIGQVPNTGFLGNLVELDEYKRIIIDPKTSKTSLDGIWAAGDCTDVLYHQNNISAGDAVRAVEDIYLWLHTK